MSIKRLEGESYIAYAKRITNGKADGTLDIDYVEWGNALINKEYSSENLRKAFYFVNSMLQNIDEEFENNFTEDDLIKEIEQKKIELQKEKIKFQDQRTAFNKVVRERARQEELNDIIIDTIKNSNLPKFEYIEKEYTSTDNDLIISLNDVHFGIEINNNWNKYNSDICRDMFEEYIDRILEIRKTHNSQNCYVCANGDFISGNIHRSLTLENKENITEQIMGVSELIANFLFELSQHFDKVTFSSVAGNHSRIGENKDVLKDERLDDLIEWYVKARIQNVDNIIINEKKIDNTMYLVNIRGKNYLGVHGSYDDSNYKIQSVANMAGEDVYCVMLGHLHHNKTDYVQGIKTMMAGSFVGTDNFTIEKRIIGQPQQLVCVATDIGVLCQYDVNFKSNV